MKLRYFSDDYVRFNTEIDPNSKSDNEIGFYSFKRLKDAIPTLHKIQDKMSREDQKHWMSNVHMLQISRQRSSKPNHILHCCEAATFFFDQRIKLYQVDFKFRDSYDLNSGGARLYVGDEWLEFYDHTLGDRIADDYFRNKCEDRELAEFLLSLKEPITY